MLLFHGAYPFFTHTQLIGRLGWLEYILVTPTHHGIHHSSNAEYLDKNYGDVLIIWDKLFGTFAERTVAPVYGLTRPLNSHSFLWQHFHFFLEISVALSRAKGFTNKLKILLGRPQHIDPQIRAVLERKLLRRNAYSPPTRLLYRYISAQTVITLVVLFMVLLFRSILDNSKVALAAAFIVISVINTGAMLEQRCWVFALEIARFILCGIWLQLSYPDFIITYIFITALAGIVLFYKSARAYYLNHLYSST
jgi:hypothetical protein